MKPTIHTPYALIVLDGPLALYAGVSPTEPIGEPVRSTWELALQALEKGYAVRVLTWRDPGLVWAWMDKAKLLETFSRHRLFDVTNTMPEGCPIVWVTGLEQAAGLVALKDRRRA